MQKCMPGCSVSIPSVMRQDLAREIEDRNLLTVRVAGLIGKYGKNFRVGRGDREAAGTGKWLAGERNGGADERPWTVWERDFIRKCPGKIVYLSISYGSSCI